MDIYKHSFQKNTIHNTTVFNINNKSYFQYYISCCVLINSALTIIFAYFPSLFSWMRQPVHVCICLIRLDFTKGIYNKMPQILIGHTALKNIKSFFLLCWVAAFFPTHFPAFEPPRRNSAEDHCFKQLKSTESAQALHLKRWQKPSWKR